MHCTLGLKLCIFMVHVGYNTVYQCSVCTQTCWGQLGALEDEWLFVSIYSLSSKSYFSLVYKWSMARGILATKVGLRSLPLLVRFMVPFITLPILNRLPSRFWQVSISPLPTTAERRRTLYRWSWEVNGLNIITCVSYMSFSSFETVRILPCCDATKRRGLLRAHRQ